MKQIVRVGNAIAIRDVPIPHASPGFIVVRNSYSLISTGTETRSLRNSSALVKGITTISRKIFAPQKAYANLGYTCAGVIEEIGEGVHGFALGDRVLCVGFDYAVHAEIVKVPAPLVFHLPQTISFTHAPFAALGSVALHALRRSNIAFGEKALVIGLGLTGQLLVRLLLLNGCSVIGVDPNDYKITLAQKAGGEYIKGKRDFAQTVLDKTGHGVDVAFVCTDMHDNENLEEIMTTIRDRGKLVAVANITCSLPFPLFFRKELDLIVS
ncbi:MAG: zinc-binding dehydrogenase, partial [Nanoarchaeota archaeon]